MGRVHQVLSIHVDELKAF